MSRRVLLVVVLVVVLLAGATVAIVASSRPDLQSDREAVDARWAPLREPLATRYGSLSQLIAALAAVGAGERTYTLDLADEVETWSTLAGRPDPDPGAEAAAANRLEGLAARTRVNVARSARLSRDPGVVAALATFDAGLVPPDQVDAYNKAVRRYQGTRTDSLAQISADLLGFEPRPVLVVGVTQSAG
ncbi:MAG: hypothetical protein FJW95_06270 [Actinobacteria bacterium]|nr:hypothetical protein [Actinomycetota bacterium]